MSQPDDEETILRQRLEESQEIIEYHDLIRFLTKQRNFAAAAQVCRDEITANPKKYDASYDYLATCEWLMGNQAAAIDTWRAGLNCQYRDGAGGGYPRLKLWYAGVVTSDHKLVNEAKELFKALLSTWRSGNWPGPICKYVMRQASESELIEASAQIDRAVRSRTTTGTSMFYLGVDCLENGETLRARECFEECVNALSEEYDDTYFLAQHELGRIR